jgi:hypothetical protein
MVAKLAGGQLVGDTVDLQYVIHTSPDHGRDPQDDGALSACPAIYQRLVEKGTTCGSRSSATRCFPAGSIPGARGPRA